MSRIERLKEITAMKGPQGQSTQRNIDAFASRASANSGAPRAKGKTSTNGKPEACLDEPRLPSTGETSIHDTSARPSRKGDARKQAKADLNFVGSSQYMRNVRRSES